MKLADITSEQERVIEEAYACRLVGRDVRVTFNEGDYSYTDGHLITVNPFLDGMYKNSEALRQTENELHLAPVFSYDEVKAAKLIGRMQLIHECLRARFIEIPTRVLTDELGTDFKAKDLLVQKWDLQCGLATIIDNPCTIYIYFF